MPFRDFIYTALRKSDTFRLAIHRLICAIEQPIYNGYKDPEIMALIKRVCKESDLRLTTAEAFALYAVARAQREVPGAYVEVGVYRGGSSKLIAEAKGPEKTLHLFDTFEGLPEATETDQGFFRKGMFAAPLEEVQQYLAAYPHLEYHVGWFPETAGPVEDEQFAFVFLDVDLYQSTRDGIAFFYPRLSPGGVLLTHDYQFPGVRRAFEEAGLVPKVFELANAMAMVIKR
ncbi:MAG: macrocin-O-methyltransferase [Chloroflexi bacterium]|nr:macrocin-O-methyltransferase [Chloroflexota bacterium]